MLQQFWYAVHASQPNYVFMLDTHVASSSMFGGSVHSPPRHQSSVVLLACITHFKSTARNDV